MLEISNCIICQKSEGLNTSINITVDGVKLAVLLCDEHADTTTPKDAKEAYLRRKTQIEELVKQAEALGVTVSVPDKPGKLAIATKVEQPGQPQPQQSSLQASDDSPVVDASQADLMIQRVRGIAGSIQGSNTSVESHQAYAPDQMLSQHLPEGAREGKVRLAVAEGRQGQPIVIPAVRQDGTGTTTVRVVKTGGDAEIQRRFKNLAQSRDSDGHNVHSFGQSGYLAKDCPVCHGEGVLTMKGGERQCPRCGGSGVG